MNFEISIDSEMIEIGYWKIRGLVGGVRVLLEHVGEQWKETFYEAHLPEARTPNDFLKPIEFVCSKSCHFV